MDKGIKFAHISRQVEGLCISRAVPNHKAFHVATKPTLKQQELSFATTYMYLPVADSNLHYNL